MENSSTNSIFTHEKDSTNSTSESDFIELRSRGRHGNDTHSWRQKSTSSPSSLNKRTIIEHPVENGQTLMQIALKYSVQVSEIKRINNIVSDQEIFALRNVRIPVDCSFFIQKHLSSQTTEAQVPVRIESVSSHANIEVTKPLLDFEEENLEDEIEIRSTSSMNSEAFHFIDATSPNGDSSGLWMLIIGVILVFVCIPLIITLLEEKK